MALKFLNDGYFAGKVGIGTESPLKKLSINGGDVAVNNGNSFIVGAAITGNTQIGELGADSGQLQLLTESTRDIKFGSTTYGNIMFLEGTNGNVGIGTASPTTKLNVSGNISVSSGNYLSFIDSNLSYNKIGRNTSVGGIQITTGASATMNLLDNGNVGIGTTSPGRKLQVEGGDFYTNDKSDTAGATVGYGGNSFQIRNGDTSEDLNFDIFNRTTSVWGTPLIIKNTGNVGIGTTSPTSQLSIGSNAITTKKPTVIIADGVAGGSLVIRGLSPILSFDRTGANPENKILMDDAGLEFKTGSLDAEGDVDFKIKLDGKLQAPAYTQGFLQSDANGNIEISGGGTLPGGPYLPLAGGTMTGVAGVVFPDAFKLNLGTGSDLQIYHDSSDNNSYIKEVGTGSLQIWAKDFEVYNADGTETLINADVNAGVQLYFDNSLKIATTTTGVTVTGEIIANGNITTVTTGGAALNLRRDDTSISGTNTLGSIAFQGDDPVDGTFNDGAAIFGKADGSWASGSYPGQLLLQTRNTSGSLATALTLAKDQTSTFAGDATVNGTIASLNTNDFGTIRFGNNGNRYVRGNSAELQIGSTLNNIHFQSTGANRIDSGAADGTAAFRINARTSHTSGNLFEVTNANSIKLAIDYDGDTTFTTQAFATTATSSGDASSTLTTKGYVDGLITGATIYRGTWDPDVSLNSGYGSPDLSGVTQTSGYYYICSADGAATPNGATTEPNTWNTGDWVIWNDDIGTSGEWQKIDNSSVLSGVGTGQTVALWEGAGSVTDSETLGNAPITVSGTTTIFGGSVGIGSSPSDKLTVSGSGNFGIKIDNSSNTSVDYSVIRLIQDSAEKGVIYTNQEDLYLRSPSGDVLLQHSGGNVGIGTTLPTTALTIRKAISPTAYGAQASMIEFKSYYTGYDTETVKSAIYSGVSDVTGLQTTRGFMSFWTADFVTGGGESLTEKMRIESNGNVGIGTTSPDSKLSVTSTTINSEDILYLKSGADNVNDYLGIAWELGVGGNGPHSAIRSFAGPSGSDARLGFLTTSNGGTTLTEGLSVAHNSNVGIGVTDPDAKLEIKASGSTTGLTFKTTDAAGNENFFIQDGGRTGVRYYPFTIGQASGTSPATGARFQVSTTANDFVVLNDSSTGIGTITPQSKLQVAGGIQMADDTATASADKVGTMRYRTGTEYVEVTGTELVTNGDFATDSGWTKGTGWTISGGKASSDGSQTANSFMYQGGGLVPSYPKWYKVVFTISNYVSGDVGPNIGGYQAILASGNGEKIIYMNITNANSNNLIYIQASATFVGSIDNFSIMEVTEEDASYADMCMQTGASTYEWVNIVRNTY